MMREEYPLDGYDGYERDTRADANRKIESLRTSLAARDERIRELELDVDWYKPLYEDSEKDFNSAFQIFSKMKYGDRASGACPPEGGMAEIAEIISKDYAELEKDRERLGVIIEAYKATCRHGGGHPDIQAKLDRALSKVVFEQRQALNAARASEEKR